MSSEATTEVPLEDLIDLEEATDASVLPDVPEEESDLQAILTGISNLIMACDGSDEDVEKTLESIENLCGILKPSSGLPEDASDPASDTGRADIPMSGRVLVFGDGKARLFERPGAANNFFNRCTVAEYYDDIKVSGRLSGTRFPTSI